MLIFARTRQIKAISSIFWGETKILDSNRFFILITTYRKKLFLSPTGTLRRLISYIKHTFVLQFSTLAMNI